MATLIYSAKPDTGILSYSLPMNIDANKLINAIFSSKRRTNAVNRLKLVENRFLYTPSDEYNNFIEPKAIRFKNY